MTPAGDVTQLLWCVTALTQLRLGEHQPTSEIIILPTCYLLRRGVFWVYMMARNVITSCAYIMSLRDRRIGAILRSRCATG